MVVSPELVIFAIKSLIRLGAAGRRAYEDAVVGETITLPGLDIEPLEPSKEAALRLDNALSQNELRDLSDGERRLLQTKIDLVIHGDGTEEQRFAAGITLIETAQFHFPSLRLDARGAGIWVVQQWRPEDRPATPLERMGLALVDIGLEYVAANPGKIGLGGNADKLIAGIAGNLQVLLPDANDIFKPGNDFAEGAIRIFLQASLTALNEHVDDFVEEDSVRELSTAVLKPLIDKVAKGDTGTQRWYDIRDVLLGPISEAAIETLAKHQTDLLGKTFDPATGIGAVTESVLLAVKENGLADDLGREGVLRIYRAALNVAVKQPDLFVGMVTVNGTPTDVGQDLLRRAAATLQHNSPPFTKSLMVELLAGSIETIGENAPILVEFDGAWGPLKTEAVNKVVSAVSDGLIEGVRGQRRPDILSRLFNEEQATRFFGLLLNQVTANPGMIVGSHAAPELRAMAEIMSRAMAKQETMLLSAEDWLLVAAAVSEEIARNPQRLIRLDVAEPEAQLGYKVISGLLNAAAEDFEAAGRANGSVMFGTTLSATIVDSLKAAAGNADRALANTDALKALAGRLNKLNQLETRRIGHREWRFLFRKLVAEVLDTGKVPEFTDGQFLALLEEMQAEPKPLMEA